MKDIFIYHENASGKASFTRTGDAWAVNKEKKAFAVGDSPLRCLIRDLKKYPEEDYGYDAASTFCNDFVNAITELPSAKVNKESLLMALKKANQGIKNLNQKLNKQYNDLENYDVAETVGMGAIVVEDKLFYGGLEDCYVNIIRGNNLTDVTVLDYQILKAGKYIDKLSKQNKLREYIPSVLSNLKKESEWEPCWCNYLRNNKDALDENSELVGWGCFTGEETAEYFIQTHEIDLKIGDKVLIFSDGMIPVLENKELLKWIFDNYSSSFWFQYQMRNKLAETLKSNEVDKEKTLIIYEHSND